MAFWLLLLPSLPAAEVREPTGIDAGAVSLHTGDTRALCQRGDAFFRNAEFERAEQSYLEAAELDPGNARAYLGLGRISRLQFQRIAAHENFDRAFRLDPHDPEILLAYSEYVSDPRV